jgi:two-component system chemotaxis sensor kinase CheA
MAFAVEGVLHEQEVLVKNLGRPLIRVRNIAAATVLGSGAPVLILNIVDLLRSAVRLAASEVVRSVPGVADGERRVHQVLVADDSVTSRMLLKNILESAGYHVTTAVDGLEAFTTLRNGEFDVVVSDVEMPRMDGFDLTTKIRADKKCAETPVVLVTALSSREHRERGVDVGANAYIVKSSFDQSNLLEVIRTLV